MSPVSRILSAAKIHVFRFIARLLNDYRHDNVRWLACNHPARLHLIDAFICWVYKERWNKEVDLFDTIKTEVGQV